MENKKISIIVPIYNGEIYIKKLVEKLKEQKGNFSIELIALVSFSKDKSLEISKELFALFKTRCKLLILIVL